MLGLLEGAEKEEKQEGKPGANSYAYDDGLAKLLTKVELDPVHYRLGWACAVLPISR